MCKNLVEKGSLDKPVIIFNRTPKRAEDFNAQIGLGKSSVAASVEEAVSQADIIFTCLTDDAAMKDTISVAIQQDVSGKLFVDCSTIHPNTTSALAQTLKEKSAAFVASPIFGGPAMAEVGQLAFVLGNKIPCADRL